MELQSIFDELNLRKKRIYSDYIFACCPFHDDNSPSFQIREDWYHCFSCGAKGRTAELLDGYDNYYSEDNNYKLFSPWKKWLDEFDTVSNVLKDGYETLQKHPERDYYLTVKRKLSKEVIKNAKLGWLNGWITVPVTDRAGRIIGGTVRNTVNSILRYCNPSKTFQPDNLIYAPNWKRVNASAEVVLVFGIMDALTLEQYKVPAITTTMGAKNTNLFSGIRKTIHVVPDKGENKLVRRLVNDLDWRGKLHTLDFPDGLKDINDLHKNERMEVFFDAGLACNI